MPSIADIRTMMEPLRRRVMLMAGKATVENSDDSGGTQRLQVTVLSDEVLDGVERAGVYGISSRPLPGAAAVVLFMAGNRSNGVVVATEDGRYRVKNLAPGEVAVYNHTGSSIILKADGSVAIDAPHVTISGDLVVTGDVVGEGISLSTHTHTDPQGGSTGGPQ